MSFRLTDCVNPWKAADKAMLASGRVFLDEMPRINRVVAESGGELSVSLEFSRNQEGFAQVSGKLECSLGLQCQRCMQTMHLPVKSEFSLIFVKATEINADLAEQYDLYEVDEERVCLIDLLEDELLLFIPQVPMHYAPVCEIQTEFGNISEAADTESRENPFAVLASLKNKLNS